MVSKRGQSAIEFMILVGAVLFFFVVFLIAVQGNITGRVVENKNFMLKEVATTLQSEIDLARYSVDGYYREFTLPVSIVGEEYLISVSDGLVYVRTVDGSSALSLSIYDMFQGQPNPGDNFIRKEEGVIYLNE